LTSKNIPVPETLASYTSFSELDSLPADLSRFDEFVVKPNAGSQGRGILVVWGRKGKGFVSSSGSPISGEQIKDQIAEIINGNYSQLGDSDTAYIEPLIRQHPVLDDIAPYGLSDIRLIISEGKLIGAMLRIPTKLSGGKANLHQGALGAALDLNTGAVTRCTLKGALMPSHPDSKKAIVSVQLPYWSQIVKMAMDCYQVIPLGYMGVDICIDRNQGPVVLEVNGRPGLEIQNVHGQGLYGLMGRLQSSNSTAAQPRRIA